MAYENIHLHKLYDSCFAFDDEKKQFAFILITLSHISLSFYGDEKSYSLLKCERSIRKGTYVIIRTHILV
jgi:hypothetical protein